MAGTSVVYTTGVVFIVDVLTDVGSISDCDVVPVIDVLSDVAEALLVGV